MAPSNDAAPVSFKLPAKFILIYLLAAAAISVVMPLVKSRPGEQIVYTKAALRLMDGEEFYRPEEGKAFTYPPFFALPFGESSLAAAVRCRLASSASWAWNARW